MITQEELKHRDELYKSSRIISELGYEPDISMCCDKPDICLPSAQDRQIGIEVVAYSTHRYEESENVMYKIFMAKNDKSKEVDINEVALSLGKSLISRLKGYRKRFLRLNGQKITLENSYQMM
ncbi:MAG: hypothetical protein IJ804_04670 [Prevotella sp.]|nr:hypothetical protein [Prevotella sp.]